jgi:VanZ family protein
MESRVDKLPAPRTPIQTLGRLAFWAGPPVLLMGVIYASGTEVASSPRTEGLITQLLALLAPAWAATLTPATLEEINHWGRKGTHFGAYAVLATLVARAFWGLQSRLVPRAALAAWCIAVAWASVDEHHQSFSPTRGSSIYDVLLDSAGAATGVALYFLWKNRSSRRGG